MCLGVTLCVLSPENEPLYNTLPRQTGAHVKVIYLTSSPRKMSLCSHWPISRELSNHLDGTKFHLSHQAPCILGRFTRIFSREIPGTPSSTYSRNRTPNKAGNPSRTKGECASSQGRTMVFCLLLNLARMHLGFL